MEFFLIIFLRDTYFLLLYSLIIKKVFLKGVISLNQKNPISIPHFYLYSFYIPEKTEIIEEIKCKMEDYDVIIKTIFPNTFACGNQLTDVISNRKNLVICGTWTDSCIKHTADAAVEKNIRPYILKHGCSGHWPFSSWSMIVQGMLQSEIIKSVEYFYLH